MDFIARALPYIMLVLVLIVAFYLIKSLIKGDEPEITWKDDLLYDPETNTKITLEQAESGNWLARDEDPDRIVPDEEIEANYADTAKLPQRIKNYLIAENFLQQEFDDEFQQEIAGLVILAKYKSWSCEDLFVSDDGSGIFDLVIETTSGRQAFTSRTVMGAKILEGGFGHYIFAPKTLADRLYDFVEQQDVVNIPGYETHEVVRSHNIIGINRMLETFRKNEVLFEIELLDDILFFKFCRDQSLEDVRLAREILKTL